MKKTSKNNDFLNTAKKNSSTKVYNVILDLVNDGRQDLAEIVTKIDYLLEYTSTCIKKKDFSEARESIKLVEDRIKLLEESTTDISYIKYLYEGIKNKVK